MNEYARIGLLAAAGLFILFVLLKSRLPLGRGRTASPEARRKLAEAKRAVREAGADKQARAKALRQAATLALEELQRPNLAASFALRADRADPGDGASVSTLAVAMRRASRFRALEKLLWRRLERSTGESYERAFTELLSLYEGPLRRPYQARALRRIRKGARTSSEIPKGKPAALGESEGSA